jgi:DNA-binding response OmpR family regulator
VTALTAIHGRSPVRERVTPSAQHGCRLRANVSTKDAIIVAVTARAFATDRQAAHRAGCDAFISKPFDLTTLADYVDRLLVGGARSCKSSAFEV